MRRPLVALALCLAALLGTTTAPARQQRALVEIAASELPAEARHTLALIERGGPFPQRRDGIVFANRERRLPIQPRGYYREYTVPTPGAHDRGARRIVAGAGEIDDVRRSGEYYYSDDHYRSFRRIRE